MFADEIRAALPGLQGYAESLMTSTFAASALEWAKVGGLDEQTWVAKGETLGKVQASSGKDSQTRYVTVGEVERPVVEGGLHIPISAPVPEIGWVYECTAVGPGVDPALVGRRWRV